MGSLLGWVIAGLIAGGLARRVAGMEKMGCLTTMAIGVIGALIGGAFMNAAGGEGLTGFTIWSVFVAFIGACALLFLLQALAGRKR
jgi:uncharacterized membrane protein YeaQ/YmgE (transglycosylase-associated protein family)